MIEEQILKHKAKNLILSSSRFAKGVFSGYYRSVFRGSGIEIEEVRPYQPGDDIKNIDWNVTARTGAAHTKLFREERDLPVMIVFDVSASMNFGTGNWTKRECAAASAALIAYAAVYNHDQLGSVLLTTEIEKWIKPGNGSIQAAGCVKDFLELVPKNKGSDLNSVLQAVTAAALRRGIVFIISDFKMEIDPLILWRLKRKQRVVGIKITDIAETAPPVIGISVYRDMENSRSEFLKARQQRRQTEKRRIGIDMIEVKTGDDPYTIIRGYFKKRAAQ